MTLTPKLSSTIDRSLLMTCTAHTLRTPEMFQSYLNDSTMLIRYTTLPGSFSQNNTTY